MTDPAPDPVQPRPDPVLVEGPAPSVVVPPLEPPPSALPTVEPLMPIGAAAASERDVAAPEVVQGQSDSLALADGDLRGRLPRTESVREVPKGAPTPRSPLGWPPRLGRTSG